MSNGYEFIMNSKIDEAKKAYNSVLKMNPDNTEVVEFLEELEKQ